MQEISELAHTLTSKWNSAGSFDLKSLGLEDASNGQGSLKVAVGTPKGMPNVIVKVMRDKDVCALFLWAIFIGELKSKHFPVVHAFVRADGGFLVVMERCTGKFLNDKEEAEGDFKGLFSDCVGSTDKWRLGGIKDPEIKSAVDQIIALDNRLSEPLFRGDFHNGNYCRRSPEDDTVVFFDPVFNRHIGTDVFNFWKGPEKP